MPLLDMFFLFYFFFRAIEWLVFKGKIMSIPAQRFQFLDKETNVPSVKYTSSLDSAIQNATSNSPPEGLASLQDLIDSSIQDTNNQAAAAENSFNAENTLADITRTAKDIGSSILDLTSLPDKVLDSYLGDLMPDAGMSRNIKGMIQKCQTRGSGYGVPGRPYDASINCGAGRMSVGQRTNGGYGGTGCNASNYGNLLNKLSGGNYNSGFNDYNKALQALMTLAGLGYNMDLCGVFGAVGNNLPNDILSKASGGLMSIMGQASKTNAVLDIAKSSLGLTPNLFYPSAVSTFLGNYKKPRNIKESDLVDMNERTLAGLELMDSDWDKSDYDGSLSICKAPGYQEDLNDQFLSSLSEKAYDENSLDSIPNDDSDYLFASYGVKADIPEDNSNVVFYT